MPERVSATLYLLPTDVRVVCSIWVYAMVGVDYGGDAMIRHFIDYYHDLGVPYDRFIFVLHHNPAFPDDTTSSEHSLASVVSSGCNHARDETTGGHCSDKCSVSAGYARTQAFLRSNNFAFR